MGQVRVHLDHARVTLAVGAREALTVPEAALVRRGQLDGVFVLEGDGRLAYRIVHSGRETAPGRREVLAGLAAGERIVVGGTERPRSEWCIWPPSTATSFIYDPGGDTWAEGPSMPFADDPGAAVLLDDGSVVVIDGTIPIPEAIIDAPQREPVPWTARLVLEQGS